MAHCIMSGGDPQDPEPRTEGATHFHAGLLYGRCGLAVVGGDGSLQGPVPEGDGPRQLWWVLGSEGLRVARRRHRRPDATVRFESMPVGKPQSTGAKNGINGAPSATSATATRSLDVFIHTIV